MVKRIVVLVVCLLMPLLAHAQGPPPFTYQNLDTRVDGRPIVIVAFTGTGVAANVMGLGALSWRLDVSDLANPVLTPVQCAPTDFQRGPTSFRAGPFIAGMSDDGTIVGDDESFAGGTTAILQLASGRCFPYQYPGAQTRFTGIARAGGRVAGVFSEPLGNRARFHGFLLDYTVSLVGGVEQVTWGTPVVLDGPGATTRNFPTAANSNGVVVGYSEVNIQPDNTYTYAAWLRWPDGTFEPLTVPNGQPTCPVAINDTPVVLLTEKTCNVNGGPAWWYDANTHTHYPLPMPTPDTVTLAPTALTNTGAFAGFYTRRIATGFPPPGDTRNEVHGFIALPEVSPTPTEVPPATKDKPREKKPKERGRGEKGS